MRDLILFTIGMVILLTAIFFEHLTLGTEQWAEHPRWEFKQCPDGRSVNTSIGMTCEPSTMLHLTHGETVYDTKAHLGIAGGNLMVGKNGDQKTVIQFESDGKQVLTITDKGFFAEGMKPIHDSGRIYRQLKKFLDGECADDAHTSR